MTTVIMSRKFIVIEKKSLPQVVVFSTVAGIIYFEVEYNYGER